jgi:hypothetical protein
MTTIQSGLLSLNATANGIRFSNTDDGQTLIHSPGGWPLLPCINGTVPALELAEQRNRPDGFTLVMRAARPGPLSSLHIHGRSSAAGLDLWCEFEVVETCRLNALQVLPAGSGLNLYDAVNFRNRHFTPATWPEFLIGLGGETTTYSDDWQFAPHPTAMIFRKAETSLFAGFLELQAGFGMRLKVKQSVVERWDVNFGDTPHGLELSKGATFRSARLRLFLRQNRMPHELFTEFGSMLVSEGQIPDPAAKVRADWWREPIYCTWGDQWMQANKAPAVSLADQTAGEAASATAILDEALVWRAVEIIRRERLPIRTIILDEGWALARGDWRPHPERLPDLRAMVDKLHSLGFKVAVWWNWAEIARDAEVDETYLVNDGRWLNKHGCRWRDYSDPRVQEGYLKPLFRTLFSDEPGCYDLDGVKTDFLADKVHPETPVHDPEWRGEERYFYRTTRLFHEEMRRHKKDALHLGCAGHYWLADLIDLNRTYDVHSSNWLEYEERARMLMCISPGVPPSYDMMTCTENTDRWFESARRIGASVEIGNVLHQRPDAFTTVRPADDDYWSLLRSGL